MFSTNPSFNTQPPEGGCIVEEYGAAVLIVSTHSRPKAADGANRRSHQQFQFQHTAARRRLLTFKPLYLRQRCFNTQPPEGGCRRGSGYKSPVVVSTHSRPKAAELEM